MVSYVVGNEIACYQLALQPPEVLALKWNMARDAAAWGRHPTNATTSSRYSELLLHISLCQFGNATQQRCAFPFLCGSAATSTKAQKAEQHSVLCIYIEQRHSTNIANISGMLTYQVAFANPLNAINDQEKERVAGQRLTMERRLCNMTPVWQTLNDLILQLSVQPAWKQDFT